MSARRWRGEGAPPLPLIMAASDAKRVAAGRKTELRRLVRREPLTGGFKAPGMRVGATHDVQTSMEGDPLARIIVTSVEAQAVTAITFDQARAEGHKTRAAFAAEWMLKHDRHWPLLEEAPCPVCEGFAEIDGERCTAGCDEVGIAMIEADLDDEAILNVFTARHAQRWVWVVRFELAQHLYLHRKTDGGYTADPREALVDAGAVLDPPHPDWARHAQHHHREAQRSSNGARLAGLRTDEERLAELKAMAVEANVDVGSDLRVITSRVDAIERKVLDKTERRDAA